MKIIFYLIAVVAISGCNHLHTMDNKNFIAERVSNTASFTANGSIEDVFPLFTPFEEKKWADGWSPELIYPQSGHIEEGLIFKTKGHVPGEKENIWVINKYEPTNHLVQYGIQAPERCLTITVLCTKLSDSVTNTTVTYTFTGLTAEGNDIGKHILAHMYQHNLTDWQQAINHYLQTGTLLKHAE